MQGKCKLCGREGRIRKGWCDAHYFRWYRTGAPGPVEVTTKVKGGTTCTYAGCTERAAAKGLCNTHYTRHRRQGDPGIAGKPAPRIGPANNQWRGDSVGYVGLHIRLRRMLGAATSYTCVTCNGVAAEWAYDHADPNALTSDMGPFSTNPAHYQPMCLSCHRRADKSRT